MNESELYKELAILTKAKNRWKESILYVSSLLNYESEKIPAKAVWLLGEMGLMYRGCGQNPGPGITEQGGSAHVYLRTKDESSLDVSLWKIQL